MARWATGKAVATFQNTQAMLNDALHVSGYLRITKEDGQTAEGFMAANHIECQPQTQAWSGTITLNSADGARAEIDMLDVKAINPGDPPEPSSPAKISP